MKIRATDITYYISDEDVMDHMNVVLELDELNNFKNTNDIEIDKSIFDAYEPDNYILIAFVEIPGIVFSYKMYKEDYDSIYCTIDRFYSYEEIKEDIIANLPEVLDFTLNGEFSAEDLDEFVPNLVSDATCFLIEGLSYHIVEE